MKWLKSPSFLEVQLAPFDNLISLKMAIQMFSDVFMRNLGDIKSAKTLDERKAATLDAVPKSMAMDNEISVACMEFLAKFFTELGIPNDKKDKLDDFKTYGDPKPYYEVVHLVQHLHELPEEAFELIAQAMGDVKAGKVLECTKSEPVWKKGLPGPFTWYLRNGQPTLITHDVNLATEFKTLQLTIWEEKETGTITFGTGFVGAQPARSVPTLTGAIAAGKKKYDDDEIKGLANSFSTTDVFGLYVEA